MWGHFAGSPGETLIKVSPSTLKSFPWNVFQVSPGVIDFFVVLWVTSGGSRDSWRDIVFALGKLIRTQENLGGNFEALPGETFSGVRGNFYKSFPKLSKKFPLECC